MSTTAYDHHDIDCSQSPFFSVRSSTYRPLRTAILVSNVLRGRVSGFIAVGRKANTLPKEGQFVTHPQARLVTQDGRQQGQVPVSYDLTEK